MTIYNRILENFTTSEPIACRMFDSLKHTINRAIVTFRNLEHETFALFYPWVPKRLELAYDDTFANSKQDVRVKLGFIKKIAASFRHHCIANIVVKVLTSQDSLKTNDHDGSDDGVVYILK